MRLLIPHLEGLGLGNQFVQCLMSLSVAGGPNSAFTDSCQRIRQESRIEVIYLNQKQPAARWHLSEATLGGSDYAPSSLLANTDCTSRRPSAIR